MWWAIHLVGCSRGRLAEKRPDLIANVLLLAPAIDNFGAATEGRHPSSWHMPGDYVDELRSYPARPNIVRPTTLVHGWLDDDTRGSAPWRIREWAAEQSFRNVFMLAGVGHSLEPWLSAATWISDETSHVPTLQQIVAELVSN